MSAVIPQQRERRKTAGQRMSALVGNAQDEDDAFWGHDTWADDASSSGNESFRDSDQDSTLRKDEFDSDFNDSETDHEDEEEAAGRQEERELQQQERSNRQGGKNNYVEQRVVVKPGRGLFHKPKRAMGNGINAGLVLNLPPSMTMESTTSAAASGGLMATGPESATLPLVPDSSVSSMPPGGPVPSLSSTHPLPPPATKSPRKTKELGVGKNSSTLVTARQRRSQTKKRDSRNSTPIYSDAPPSQQHSSNNNNKRPRSQMGVTHKSKRRRYMQEELLVEAVQETEPENQRWLLARKRVQDSADQDKDTLAALREKQRGKNVIQKYHSRRGCLVTLTFPEMDAVPELFTRKSETPSQPERLVCVITGKPAKYRDPKTGKGYYDTAAFKELRKRHDAGVPLDQRPKSKPKPKDDDAISVSGPGESSTQDAASKPVVLSPKPTTGFVLDLGGDKKSPGSTRSSARKWKPSEKMLTGMGIIHTAEDGTSSSSHSEKVEDLLLVANAPPLLPPIRSTSSNNPFEEKKEAVTSAAADGMTSSIVPMAPSVVAAKAPGVAAKTPAVAAKTPSVTAKAPAVTAKAPAVVAKAKAPSVVAAKAKAPSVVAAKAPSVAAKGSASVESKPPGERTAVPAGEPGVASNSRPNGKAPSAATAEKRRSNGNGAANVPTSTVSLTPTLLAPSNVQIPVTHPSEPVYVIPGDSDNGSAEPKYVTQSELIMQAISNYNRSTMDPNKSQNHDSH